MRPFSLHESVYLFNPFVNALAFVLSDSFDGTQSSTKASDKNGSEGSDKKSEGNENLSTEEGLVASVDKQKEPRPALSVDPSKSSDVDSNGVRLSPRKVKKKDMVVTRLQKASRISHAETCRIVEELVLNAFESCDTVRDISVCLQVMYSPLHNFVAFRTTTGSSSTRNSANGY